MKSRATTRRTARIYVFAGVNGSGKSSVGGAAFRNAGAQYYNPDEAARRYLEQRPGIGQTSANSLAWQKGKSLLERAIREQCDFAFETTLGANTIPALLSDAARAGIEVHVWFVGLATPEMHVARVASRVRKGGHAISEADIRRRFKHSRLNLIELMPRLTELRLYDNSVEADPEKGLAPRPRLLLHVNRGRILLAETSSECPAWARPIVAAALKSAHPGA